MIKTEHVKSVKKTEYTKNKKTNTNLTEPNMHIFINITPESILVRRRAIGKSCIRRLARTKRANLITTAEAGEALEPT